MAFKLTTEAQARYNQTRAWEEEEKAKYANLSSENLVAAARMCTAQMTPMRFAPGEPVYDATMWHIILPELLRRVGRER